jgi:multidrug transporter EmrE-like cation transporter
LLILGGLIEMPIIALFRLSEGFTNLWPAVGCVALIAINIFIFSVVTKTITLSTAYIVWFAFGAIGVTLVGTFIFHEPLIWQKAVALGMVLISVIVLKWADGLSVSGGING